MPESWEPVVAVIAAVLIAYASVLWLGVIVWTYRDIRARTRDGASQALAVLLVVLFNIPGLFLYLILRPHETLAEAYERRLEAEAIRQELAEQRRACPTCQRAVKEEFLYCPACCTQLQAPCERCGRALQLTWVACAYCGGPGPNAMAAPTAATVAAPPSVPMPAAAPANPGPQPTPVAVRATGEPSTRPGARRRAPPSRPRPGAAPAPAPTSNPPPASPQTGPTP